MHSAVKAARALLRVDEFSNYCASHGLQFAVMLRERLDFAIIFSSAAKSRLTDLQVGFLVRKRAERITD